MLTLNVIKVLMEIAPDDAKKIRSALENNRCDLYYNGKITDEDMDGFNKVLVVLQGR